MIWHLGAASDLFSTAASRWLDTTGFTPPTLARGCRLWQMRLNQKIKFIVNIFNDARTEIIRHRTTATVALVFPATPSGSVSDTSRILTANTKIMKR